MDPQSEFEYETSEGQRISGTLDSFRRLAVALLFAAVDMRQAAAACNMLEEETSDPHRARALETAIAVCYARAFTESTVRQLPARAFAPKKRSPERELHDVLMNLRQKVYAHTDLESGRSLAKLVIEVEGDATHVEHVERWHPLDSDLLNPIRELCNTQEERLRLEATRIVGALARMEGAASRVAT